MAQIDVSDIRTAERLLRDLDSDYLKEFRKDVKDIAKPVQREIKTGITYTKMNPPLTGMKQVHFGRVAWGTDYAGSGKRPKPIKSALIQRVPEKARRQRRTTSIVRVVVGSPGTVLADMAGSGNMKASREGQVTRSYQYMYRNGPGTRTHRINGQGEAFVRNLNSVYGSSASRFIWPSAEKAGPEVRKKLDEVIDKYNRRLNRQLRIMNAR